MRDLPVKEQFRPTLPELLAPRWRRMSRARRGPLVGAVAALAAAAALIAIFYPRDPWIVHGGGPVSFSLRYPRALHRVPAPPGAYARIEARSGSRLTESLEVDPLRLPPYRGEISGILPTYANGYIARLAAALPNFQLVSEGKPHVTLLPGYWFSFSATVQGRRMFGRSLFILPRLAGARDGVTISMLTVPHPNVPVADQVALMGDFYEPLKTFAFRH